MRSITLKSGLAAILLSVSAAGAFAASPQPITGTDQAPTSVVEEPRVDVVLQQLASTVDGIKTQNIDKNLSAETTAKLDRDAAGIRKDVEKIAAQHAGKVPKADYHQIMARIDDLNLQGKTQPPGNY